jgi:hypothetical protein
MLNLPHSPSEADIAENSDCKKCRQDWGKQGRVCGHCRLEGVIIEYQQHVFAHRKHTKKTQHAQAWNLERGPDELNGASASASASGDFFEVEGVVIRLAKLLHRFLHKYAKQLDHCLKHYTDTLPRSHNSSDVDTADFASVDSLIVASERCLVYLEALQREVMPLKLLWRQQLHCYSVLDELQTAKVPLQLLRLDTVATAASPLVPSGTENKNHNDAAPVSDSAKLQGSSIGFLTFCNV